jgi:hypothetical protein
VRLFSFVLIDGRRFEHISINVKMTQRESRISLISLINVEMTNVVPQSFEPHQNPAEQSAQPPKENPPSGDSGRLKTSQAKVL